MVGAGIIDAQAAARGSGGFFELRSLLREARLGEAQEDEAEDGRGVLPRLQAGVGAELIGGRPQAFFERVVGVVLFVWALPSALLPPLHVLIS